MQITTQEIQDTIKNKKIKTGSNGKEYLILELNKGEKEGVYSELFQSIFVFDNKDTPASKWAELQEGNEYLFTVKEGNKFGTNILVHFEKMDFIV